MVLISLLAYNPLNPEPRTSLSTHARTHTPRCVAVQLKESPFAFQPHLYLLISLFDGRSGDQYRT